MQRYKIKRISHTKKILNPTFLSRTDVSTYKKASPFLHGERLLLIYIYIMCSSLELCVFGCSGEGNDVADVLHAGNEEDESFETETEAGMWT